MPEKTLLKGLALLEALSGSPKPRGVTDLACSLELSKTATHRLLQTLLSAGYVVREDGAGAYALTTKAWQVGSAALARMDAKTIGAKYLPALADASRESVHIAILDGADVIYVDKIDSAHPLRTHSALGGRAPAACVATGKALLAHHSDEVANKVAASLRRHTPRSIISRAALAKELEKVRRKGYAINNCEWREDICSVAAPIFNAQRSVAAAIGISGPAYRIGRTLDNLGILVARAAREISRELGCATTAEVGAGSSARDIPPIIAAKRRCHRKSVSVHTKLSRP
jgi:DNA-binding IclR family transcriptional regulator